MWASRGVGGVVEDKWAKRILWVCAFGTAISLYFVAVERHAQNRARAMAEGFKHLDEPSPKSSGHDV